MNSRQFCGHLIAMKSRSLTETNHKIPSNSSVHCVVYTGTRQTHLKSPQRSPLESPVKIQLTQTLNTRFKGTSIFLSLCDRTSTAAAQVWVPCGYDSLPYLKGS